MSADPLRIGITLGDPAGVGPEVVAAALREPWAGTHFRVFGDARALERAGGVPAGVEVEHQASAETEPGRPDPKAARGVVDAIKLAAREALTGRLDAIVTAPLSKEILSQGGFSFPGHTELLAEICAARPVMLLVGGKLRVALATVHCPLAEVASRLKVTELAQTLRILVSDLRTRFHLSRPRIAVCGLNPHAGEGGRFGDEEARILLPAIEAVRAEGIDARGPFAADSLFHRAVQGEFDVVLAMYHDQGLAPLKLHAFGRAVNITLGLPIIRTSVDHGTAFDIAGSGRADAGSMIEAIRLAIQLASNARAGE